MQQKNKDVGFAIANPIDKAKARWDRYAEFVKRLGEGSRSEVFPVGEDATEIQGVSGKEAECKYVGSVDNNKWLEKDWDKSRGNREGYRVYSEDGISPALRSQLGGASKGSTIIAKAMQLVGDRDNPSISIKDEAFTLPANPMSDRGQAVISPCITQVVGRKGCSSEEMSQVNAIARCLDSNMHKGVTPESYFEKNKRNLVNCIGLIPETCHKRVFDTPNEINQFLKNARTESLKSSKKRYTIPKIAEILNLPITQVGHYFRTDSSRAVPSPGVWIKLKDILGLSDTYDKQVTDVYEKQIEFEQTRRVYDSEGIMPTLNATKEPIVYKLHRANEIREYDGEVPTLTESHEHKGGSNQPIVPCLTKNMGDGGNNVPIVMNLQTRSADRPSLLKNPKAGGSGTICKEDEAYCLDIGCNQGVSVKAFLTPDRENKRQNGRRQKDEEEPMFTLTGQDIHGVNYEGRLRRLTPTECERLQSFPDSWTEYGIDDKGNKVKISDTQRYKQMGNAVTVSVIEAIAKELGYL